MLENREGLLSYCVGAAGVEQQSVVRRAAIALKGGIVTMQQKICTGHRLLEQFNIVIS